MNIEGLARVTPVGIDTVDKVKTECLTNAVTKRRAKCESVKVSWNVPELFACSQPSYNEVPLSITMFCPVIDLDNARSLTCSATSW